MTSPSVNFAFLASHDPMLVAYAAEAEGAFHMAPALCVARLRTFAEAIAKHAAAYSSVYLVGREDFGGLIGRLRDRGVVEGTIAQVLHTLRREGNDAIHAGSADRPPRQYTHRDALTNLRLARELAIWFHCAFGEPRFKPSPFVPPPDPAKPSAETRAELERLRAEVTRLAEVQAAAADQARLRQQAEDRAAQAYAEVEAAMELATEAEARRVEAMAAFEARLAQVQAEAIAAPEKADARVQAARRASSSVELDEAATRALIDAQLRESGWEVDSEVLRFARGARPEKGRNVAIAEWPTASGPADYAMFVGPVLVGVVEAKKRSVDVMSALDQARRYAQGVKLVEGVELAGGPWGDARVPFVFATNGRAFLEQLRTRSGVWFRDLRRPSNPSTPLAGWKTPAGLLESLKADVDAAHAALRRDPVEALGLRDYQSEAIRKVEAAIEAGERSLLVAMATGTGKTRTCVGLVYRLIKARRFRRVLFLVDRTTLGTQAADAFKDAKLENYQSFTDIYDVKLLGETDPAPETRLHFATVQGMVRRLTAAEAGDPPLPVDAYDCIIVDESHRGYSADREMSDVELEFRSEADYISKYRRVLDHFDAVRIGLTATPTDTTFQIFGKPVFDYTYRQAVIEGWLVDHEPPYIIDTQLSREGIRFAAGERVEAYRALTGEIEDYRLPDELDFEVQAFNRAVVSDAYNDLVVQELCGEIDPFSPGKTLVFAVDNGHADTVVDLMRQAWRARYPTTFTDDLVCKITGSIDRPQQKIREFRNERAPSVAVTVDLLTTGVDIPRIVNVVFLRRVNSRILFDQMRGRATRLCPEIGKQAYRIYDAVGQIASMRDAPDRMKAVVADPTFAFERLVGELGTAPSGEALQLVLDQLLAKLQRKSATLEGERAEDFQRLAGASAHEAIDTLRQSTPEAAAAWFAARPGLAAWLDEKVFSDRRVLIAPHPDADARVEQDFGDRSPEDYLEAFRAHIAAHGNDIPALRVVTTRPRDLTRGQLRDLRMALDRAGFSERALAAAWAHRTNQDIAASILGFIRQEALGEPLEPYDRRVDRAVARILSSRPFTREQRRWLERIAKQLKVEVVVDREAVDTGAFATEGGYKALDRVFDGRLGQVLEELQEAVWTREVNG